MTKRSNAQLDGLLREIEAEISAEARRTTCRARRQAAARYVRSNSMLAGLVPPGLLRTALADPSDPAVTWRVLRCLCGHIRFNARSPLGSSARLMRCRTAAAGEVRLLARQRAARSDRAFVSGMFEEIRQAAG